MVPLTLLFTSLGWHQVFLTVGGQNYKEHLLFFTGNNTVNTARTALTFFRNASH